MDALLAIKTEFARKILSGEKGYEFRRTSFNDPAALDYVYLYATSPEQRIVGAFTTNRVVEASPEELWNLFDDVAGIDKERFFDYFNGSQVGHAIQIDDTYEFESQVDPTEEINDFSAPMSFCYLSDEESETLRSNLPHWDGKKQSTPLAHFSED